MAPLRGGHSHRGCFVSSSFTCCSGLGDWVFQAPGRWGDTIEKENMVEYYSSLVYLEVLISHRAIDESTLRSHCGGSNFLDLHRTSMKSLSRISIMLPQQVPYLRAHAD